MIGIRWYQLVEKRLSFRREPDDLEVIVGVEIFHTKPQRFLRLLKFGAGHRTGCVYDKNDVFGCWLRLVGNRRRPQKQKVPVVTVWVVTESPEAGVTCGRAANEPQMCGLPFAIACIS